MGDIEREVADTMTYRRGGMRIYGARGPLWVSVGWNMWWFGVRASWRKRSILVLDIGRTVNCIARHCA